MGRKIPLWQCLIVILAMVVFLMWSILKDTGGEPHIALILAACVAGIVAVANGWEMGLSGTGYPGIYQQIHAG